MYYHVISLDGLRKTKRALWIVGVPAEIRTEHLQNTSQQRYSHPTIWRYISTQSWPRALEMSGQLQAPAALR
jgi:hypothetical protein